MNKCVRASREREKERKTHISTYVRIEKGIEIVHLVHFPTFPLFFGWCMIRVKKISLFILCVHACKLYRRFIVF